ncbi:MAG: hypothetical protein ACJAS1_000850 [Oleiphilaceae bacterium]|jgi:hypothetical protein
MTEVAAYQIELSQTRDVVWIHSFDDGSTVGRFGRMGVDIHNSVTEQLNGASECRLCTHGKVTRSDWDLFREKALEFWQVNVSDDAFNHNLFAK